MAFLVIAYPNLGKSDYELIQDYRKKHDQLFYSVVDPHFTIVFPVFDQTQDEFVKEIERQSTNIQKFDFTMRCATINKDAFNDYFHLFLVPDEGYSDIVKLHDKLYSNLLFENLRLDIDFIPHIGIGNSKDEYECKAMVDEWNKKDFSIAGQITHLTIVDYTDNEVTELEKIELQ